MTQIQTRTERLISHASAAVNREQELNRMPKATLARMHEDNGGQMGFATYMKWRKDELVKILLEDEGLDPWSA